MRQQSSLRCGVHNDATLIRLQVYSMVQVMIQDEGRILLVPNGHYKHKHKEISCRSYILQP